MSTPPGNSPPKPNPSEPPRQKMNSSTVVVLLVLAAVMGFLLFRSQTPTRSEINYGLFRKELQADNIDSLKRDGVVATGEFKKAPVNPDAKRDQ